MSYITNPRVLSSSLRRTCMQTRTFTISQARRANQDYGSGDGDPVGEKPQNQGANPSADKEHPGPPPPKAGQDSGSSPTKGTSDGHTKPNQFTGSTQKREFSSMRRLFAEKRPKSAEGLKPKILDEKPPKGEEESNDVKQHNKEFSQRAERAHEGFKNEEAEKDKVSSKYWSEDSNDRTGGRTKDNA